MPMMGMMAMTHKASCHCMVSRIALAPTMMKMEEKMETIACETNILIESTSDVRLVSNLAELVSLQVAIALSRDTVGKFGAQIAGYLFGDICLCKAHPIGKHKDARGGRHEFPYDDVNILMFAYE